MRLSEATAADGADPASDELLCAPVASPSLATEFALHGFSDWGRDHPTMKASPEARRAEWSPAELRWIKEWTRKNLGDGVSAFSNHCHIRKCLEDIIRDKNARLTFHPLHVADSGRLRHGFRKLLPTVEK